MEALLQFAPMQSSVDEGFWHRLTILQFPYSVRPLISMFLCTVLSVSFNCFS
ncbi:hypothetical protein AAZX31_09G207000 [Glycine max]